MPDILLLFTDREKDLSEPGSLSDRTVDYLNKVSAGANYFRARYDDLIHRISNKEASIVDSVSGRDLATFDVVYQSVYAFAPEEAAACAAYLGRKGVPCVDSESNSLGFWGKLTGYWRMWGAELPIPMTYFIGQTRVRHWIEHDLGHSLAFPFVMKGNYGRRGRDNYLVESAQQALEMLDGGKRSTFIFQEYIPLPRGYRVWVCGDEVRLVIERYAPEGTHLNNARGSRGQMIDQSVLSEAAIADCVKAAQSLGREIAGVDLLIDSRQPSKHYLLEVNRFPQLFTRQNTLEKAQAMDGYLRSLAKNNLDTGQ